jgi:hypothetical protein
MNTNKTKTTKSTVSKQAKVEQCIFKAKHIKLGVDVHQDRYVVLRVVDGATPQRSITGSRHLGNETIYGLTVMQMLL